MALRCGIRVFDYWDMTYEEILLSIEAYNLNKTDDFKQKVVLNYNLANLIGVSASRIMSKDAKYPSLNEFYPDLFSDNIIKSEESKQKNIQKENWHIVKDRMMRFSSSFNKKKNNGGENN